MVLSHLKGVGEMDLKVKSVSLKKKKGKKKKGSKQGSESSSQVAVTIQ